MADDDAPGWLMSALAAQDAYRGDDAFPPPVFRGPYAREQRAAARGFPNAQAIESGLGDFGEALKTKGQELLDLGATPRDLLIGDPRYQVTPEVPGQWSERDQYRQDQLDDELANRAAQTALHVTGYGAMGAPVREYGLGAGGGRMVTPTRLQADAPGAIAEQPTLFDYSRIREVPDVKQFDLPRYAPPRGVSARVEDLTSNKKVYNQMLDYIDKGKQLDAETFYYNEPLRKAFVEELGKREGNPAFTRYMDYVAATSPRSDVPTNARNASFYYGLERRGEDLPEKNPYPYGHMAQNLHRQNVENIQSGDYFNIINNPKPLSFSQNLQGNFEPVTVDAHAFKLPAMLSRDPRFLATSLKLEKGEPTISPSRMLESGDLTMKEAVKRPVYWAAPPNPNEYAAMEQYYKRLAGDVGLTPAQTQAAAWAGGGKVTGLESRPGDPFMRAVEDRAILTAQKRGITPAEALSRMIRGREPLLGLGGAAALGSLADQGNYQQ